MEDTPVFRDRNIIGICDYISNICELYVHSTSTLTEPLVKPFYTFFPTLLVYIFGSPNARGWLHTEMPPSQDIAIRKLLSINGPFFQAIVRLSLQPEYSYDLVTERLPADVRKVLATGSIQYLPRVYSNCSYLAESTSADSVDIRAAATRQSTLSTSGGERKIKFNMLQFYLYYFLSVPTWVPETQPSSAPSTVNMVSTQLRTTPVQQNNVYNPSSKSYQYGTVKYPSSAPTQPGAGSVIGNAIPAYMFQGKPRSLMYSVYSSILEEYLQYLVPIGTSLEFPSFVHTFFLDACVELWIRTVWVTNGQKLNEESIYYISTFVKYIVQHDLKLCTTNNNNDTLYHHVYSCVKDELYMLISRLALNWSKHDDYLQVVDLWSIWAAPWKLGVAPRSYETQVFTPIQHGWGPFILDNILFYISLVDILLQRTSAFLYKDNIPHQQQQQTIQSTSTYTSDNGTIGGQLRIIYRIANVIKAQGLVDFLANIELGLQKIQSGALNMMASLPAHQNIFKTMALECFGSEKMDHIIRDKLKTAYDILVQLEGGNQTYKPKGLYANVIQPRSDVLLKTLNAIHNSMLVRETKSFITQNPAKSKKQEQQLKEAYDMLYSTFKVTGTNHLISATTPTAVGNATIYNHSAITTQYQLSDSKSRNVPTCRHRPKLAGLGDGGYLTQEEVLAVKGGMMSCSYDNIPTLGERAETCVRSYESALLVHWSIQLDHKLNFYYDRLLPDRYRPKFLPKKLTLRPWAATVNFAYTVIFLLILLYIFTKIAI